MRKSRIPDADEDMCNSPRVRWANRFRPRMGTNRSVLVVGAALVALQLAFRAWAVYGGWFHFDDFAFLSRAFDSDLGWTYLTDSYGGHLMPGAFLVTWLFSRFEPLGWWPYATTLLVLQAVASIGFLRLLVHLFGRRTAVLPLLAIYLFSVISLPAFIWWAAGINQLPLQITLFFGLHSHVTYLRTRRLRHVFATMAWTAFGLLFYEKTLLVFLAYGLVAICYFAQGSLSRRFAHLWATYRPGMLLYGLLAIGYLGLYLATSLEFDPGELYETPILPVAYRLILVAFAPGIVGGPWKWQDIEPLGRIADTNEVVIFLSSLALGYLIFLAYRTRERSLRAWLLPASFVLVDLMLLTAGRAFLVGAVIGREYRYQTELSAVFALGIGLAFLPVLGATETVTSRDRALLPFEVGPAIATLTAVFVAGAMVSNLQYASQWRSKNPGRGYFAKVKTELAEQKDPVPLADLAVPQKIMWGFRYPENTYSRLFPMYEDKTRYPSVVSDRLYVFDNSGNLRPALITSVRRNLPTVGCGYQTKGARLTVPLDDPVVGGGWWVRLGYLSDQDSKATLTAGDSVHRTQVHRGVHALFFRADGEFDEIVLSGLDKGAKVCTDDVTLGLPEPLRSR